ncbi:Trafficking kinesin-binding protein 1 [Halotydeus destructor]|nr:Trafficking kinesin-binding protein 1 [Halotydeus destructor]
MQEEHDLELAALIGQSLLEKNKDLKSRNDELETELQSCNEVIERLTFEVISATDRVTQLKHDLTLKNGLLQIYSADLESSESQPESPSHSNSASFRERDKLSSLELRWEDLHDKVCSLEDENDKLRNQVSTKRGDIEYAERKELQLIHDCAKELTDASRQLLSLQEEIARRSDDNIRQQEEITHLLSQLVDLQRRIREVTVENDGLKNAVRVSHEFQNELSCELIDLKEKYEILLCAFHELQDEAKRNSRLKSECQWPSSSFMPINESLAAEIESVSLESEGYGSEFSSLNIQSGHHNHNGVSGDSSSHLSASMLEDGPAILLRCSLPGNPANNSAHNSVGGGGGGSGSIRSLLISDKLKIVKPVEGSETLTKWKRLATPNFGALLEPAKGSVQSKALKDLNSDLLNYVINSNKEERAAGEINLTIKP